ncbi:MAG TPA: PIN domain-containing protein [Opitutaceae bacterium]|nr:PIN domain-containing protein [Opitutaceae bacterium]
MTLPLPTNHVFVDFENVHAIDPAVFGHKSVSFTLLLGPGQKKLDAALVEQLLNHVGTVELVRLAEPGKNALDFALAYYLGRAVQSDPLGFFHIVSRDKGFDPLVEHLRHRHVHARRHNDFGKLHFNGDDKVVTGSPAPTGAQFTSKPGAPALAAAPKELAVAPAPPSAAHLSEQAQLLLEYLRRNAKNRPGKESTLVRHTRSFFADKITEAESKVLIAELHAAKFLIIDPKGKLDYQRLSPNAHE